MSAILVEVRVVVVAPGLTNPHTLYLSSRLHAMPYMRSLGLYRVCLSCI